LENAAPVKRTDKQLHMPHQTVPSGSNTTKCVFFTPRHSTPRNQTKTKGSKEGTNRIMMVWTAVRTSGLHKVQHAQESVPKWWKPTLNPRYFAKYINRDKLKGTAYFVLV